MFVDEAGHGWEPEVLSSFAALLDVDANDSAAKQFQLVLAGDHKQLGPVVRSDSVNDATGGLSVSLLERLLLSSDAGAGAGTTEHHAPKGPYQRNVPLHGEAAGGYNPRVMTMLLRCYRCHPDILKLPNELFYNNALVAAADPVVTHNLQTWPGLVTQKFPLVFHGVEGENVKEGNSPSWFNVAEVELVFNYVRDLVDTKAAAADDIAVITPYHKQVTKILQLLHHRNYNNKYDKVTVGSCEQLQGQEKRVVIISTVRSSREFLDSDVYYNLGFVSNPKRFNVAVTRAKALLVVIGNPNVLARDPCWGALLRFCVERGGYKGCALPVTELDNGDGDGEGDGSAGDGQTAADAAVAGLALQMQNTTIAGGAAAATAVAGDGQEWQLMEEADWNHTEF